MLDLVRVTITKTADGKREYIQLMSADQVSVNVVVVATKLEVQDSRNCRGQR